MLFQAGLSKVFWSDSVKMAAHLANLSSRTALRLKTTEEMWSGLPADLSGMRVFGSPVYAYVNDGKLEPRAKQCIFL